MKDLPNAANVYFKRFNNYNTRYALTEPPRKDLKVILIMPAFAEDLEPCLQSLAACSLTKSGAFELILVINQSVQASQYFKKHLAQVKRWQNTVLANGLAIRVVKALDLPAKKAGVGLARKIGMDIALERFAEVNQNGLLVCLDADCTFSHNYLEVLSKAEASAHDGFSLRFAHALAPLPPAQKEYIIRYETWLRYYHEALYHCDYPHYHYTVGSSMAVRASVYAQVGGMNTRKAGEDFYFLHKVMLQTKVEALTRLEVYPSARVSNRVPFGTGRAMQELEAGKKNFKQLYHPQIFTELKELHAMVRKASPLALEQLPEPLSYFLKAQPKLRKTFEALQTRSPNSTTWQGNFWQWWDGFTLLKYVHWRGETYQDIKASQALQKLLGISGSEEQCLIKLRQLELNRKAAF
jgi:hypothetical protein